VLSEVRGLTVSQRDAIADLERRVVASDGGRLKLEWPTLERRSADRVEDLLWWQHDRLVGYLGLYGFGSTPEVAGMVDPSARRAGIGTALLDGARRLARDSGHRELLLVTPRSTPAGRGFASAHAGVLDHSEHFMVLGDAPTTAGRRADVEVREMHEEDTPDVSRILTAAFGHPPPVESLVLDDGSDQVVVIEHLGSVAGTMRLSRHAGATGIYGFAVDPAMQGRGLGRAALLTVCGRLRQAGGGLVTLEVEVHNDRALDLYTSAGFERRATEDYYLLRLS
jgi:ribosomal protein S18 acetylase RimI-like enzyme